MTEPASEVLPPSVRELDRNRLLRLDEDERAARLQDALSDLYLDAISEDGALDEDFIGEIDRSEPLILESFVAADLSAIMESWLGVTVPVSTMLLGGLSIAQLSEKLLEGLRDAVPEESAAPETGAVPARLIPGSAVPGEAFPLAEIQEAYWIGGDPVFELGNVSAFLYTEFRTLDFDVDRAEQAMRRLIERHDMLRSVILRDGRQRIQSEIPEFGVEVTDISGGSPSNVRNVLAAERKRMTEQETRPDRLQPFDIRVFRLDARRSQMNIRIDMLKMDAWSVQLLLAEWFSLYEHPERELPGIGLTFADYLVWTQEREKTPAYERAREYWLERIPSLPPAPELPLAKSFSEITAPRFTPYSTELDEVTWSHVKKRATEEGLTPYSVLCAAYTEVLRHWSRKQHFTITVATSGRPAVHPDIGRVVGPFARLSLLEVDGGVPGDFVTRAQALRQQLNSDLDHPDFSGLAVLRELARTRGLTRAGMPILFTSVLPQGGKGGGLTRPDWQLDDPYLVWGMPQLVIENEVREVEGALVITWVVVDELFPDGLIADMFDAYQRLLERLSDDEEDIWHRPHIEMRPSGQLARRAAANRTVRPTPEDLLHSALAEQAARQPDAPAVIGSGRTLSYAELDRHAGHVADQLRQRGARPNTLVAVCMEKGWEQVVAVLGVLRAGAAYLPIDPELPTRRLHTLQADSEASLALTQPWIDERLDWPDGVERLLVHEDDGWRDAKDPPSEDLQRPEDLAYVIYTSGSTGRPKGVMIDHRGALNTVLDVNRRFLVGPSDRVFALSALSFDLSVYDIFGTLAAGGAIVMPDPASVRDPAHWSELMQRERVTVWNSVPALMEMLVEQRGARADALRLVMLSGDWIPVSLPDRIVRTFGESVQMISLGGATEASVWSIFHPINGGDPGLRSIPYGRPLANQRFHILNERLEPCPDLVAGEMFIAGTGLAKGYWRDEEKTNAAFLTHPGTGERLYRTGDFGRYLPDGEVEFLGREDLQVKVGGYRIELGEIEAAMEEHPAVRSAVAIARGDREGQRALAAYVVAADGTGLADQLREFLAERLPDYEVPTWIVELDALPLTPNGKVDRGALPDVEEVAARGRAESRAPRTELEIKLARLWQDLLDVEEVGIDDDFTEIGGASIQAVRFANRAEEAGIPLRSAEVIAHPTIAELAVLVESKT